ncbi:DUF4861 family protein [Flavivirga spongiicola]|uniref:DUF4861 domain-containing protein n=1 Tax=Flavivirga spongiicola TaxID=421621 RepID=A0ABU7XW68_9FLAO|nr:DUF4861 family protein [Flavivirga sp. MEBiC05379]MDO5980021.1 DUF4861 family protein [Flavivirga sp. MEBiC05379]
MNTYKLVTCLLVAVLFSSCSNKEKTPSILVKNTLDTERSFETVELTKSLLNAEDLAMIGIRDKETGQLQITQTVDNDGDGILDVILFQPNIAANSEKKFELITVTETEKQIAPEYCYSRFVPERTDDYAWENDRVAFRVFGPTAQRLKEENQKGGTLSSGVDAWLKKVDYPIINKWYKKTTEGTGTYHEDTGEGLDNFHVGVSRGVGGIAVKVDSTYYFSKNYTHWKTITTGPLRTSFYLEYEDWNADGKLVKESRVISLDFGNNFSKFTITLEGINTISAGLTLHEKDGEVIGDKSAGWVSYWQPHGESELGTAIIASKNTFLGFEKYDIDSKDLSNAYAHLKVANNKVVYYAGFGWKESGQFDTKQAWENHLNLFSKKLQNPLRIEIIK